MCIDFFLILYSEKFNFYGKVMFDICFINFADSELDARVNNMLSALLNQGKSIALISLKNTKINHNNLKQIQIDVKQNVSGK